LRLPGGNVLVVDGHDSTEDAAASPVAQLYDHATALLTVTGPTGRPRAQHTATLLPGGEVPVFHASAEQTDTRKPTGPLDCPVPVGHQALPS